MTISELPATKESDISVSGFIDFTHSFLVDRPVMVKNNTEPEILHLLLGELNEFFEAWMLLKMVDPEDKQLAAQYELDMKAEIGDLGHFFNDFIRAVGQDITHAITQNGKRDQDVNVKQLRDFASDHYFRPETQVENQDEVIFELVALLELAIFDSLDDIHNTMRLALIMTLLFEITDALGGIDLVLLAGMKRLRNEHKYPKELFVSGEYVVARETAKKQWAQQGGDKAFFAAFQQKYAV